MTGQNEIYIDSMNNGIPNNGVWNLPCQMLQENKN